MNHCTQNVIFYSFAVMQVISIKAKNKTMFQFLLFYLKPNHCLDFTKYYQSVVLHVGKYAQDDGQTEESNSRPRLRPFHR